MTKDIEGKSAADVVADLQKEIKSLKRENKQLNKDLLEVAKNSGPIKFTEAQAGIDFMIDEQKVIRLNLSGMVGNATPAQAHSELFVEVMKSLETMVENFLVDEEKPKENVED